MVKQILLLSMISLLSACGTSNKNNLTNFSHWGYQLQNYRSPYDLRRIHRSCNTLWVIDYSRDGSEAERFDARTIKWLKHNNNTILSYLSIGEAEDYRYYFENLSKDILLNENKNWKGNFKIRYWEREWKNILMGKNGYLDRIIEAGFDGVYLDIIDGFHAFEDKLKSSNYMVELLSEIKDYTQSRNKDFFIVIQNGSDIVRFTSKAALLMKSIDAISIEDYFFLENRYVENSPVHADVAQFIQHKKPILSVEYIKGEENINKYVEMSKLKGYRALVAQRALKGELTFIDNKNQLNKVLSKCE